MTRSLLLFLAIIPGTSPFLLGHGWWALLLLFGGLNAWNLVVIGSIWVGSGATAFVSLGWTLGLASSIGSVVWTAIETSPSRRKRLRAIADRALQVGLLAHLRGKTLWACSAVEAGLQIAHRDPDLLFLAWALSRETKNDGRSRRLLRRLRRADDDRKWHWEIEHLEGWDRSD